MRNVYTAEDTVEADDLSDIFDCVYRHELKANAREHPLLLTEPALCSRRQKERIAQVLFETCGVPSIVFAPQPVLSLYEATKGRLQTDFSQIRKRKNDGCRRGRGGIAHASGCGVRRLHKHLFSAEDGRRGPLRNGAAAEAAAEKRGAADGFGRNGDGAHHQRKALRCSAVSRLQPPKGRSPKRYASRRQFVRDARRLRERRPAAV